VFNTYLQRLMAGYSWRRRLGVEEIDPTLLHSIRQRPNISTPRSFNTYARTPVHAWPQVCELGDEDFNT
jgi:hypothetical protein